MAIIINCNDTSRLALCFFVLAFCGLASIVDCRHLLQREGGEVIRSPRFVDTRVAEPICRLYNVSEDDSELCGGLIVSWTRNTGKINVHLSCSDGPESEERSICSTSKESEPKSDCLNKTKINTGFSIAWTCEPSSRLNCRTATSDAMLQITVWAPRDYNSTSFKCPSKDQ